MTTDLANANNPADSGGGGKLRQQFTLTLQAEKDEYGRDAHYRLKLALKALHRVFAFRCVKIENGKSESKATEIAS